MLLADNESTINAPVLASLATLCGSSPECFVLTGAWPDLRMILLPLDVEDAIVALQLPVQTRRLHLGGTVSRRSSAIASLTMRSAISSWA